MNKNVFDFFDDLRSKPGMFIPSPISITHLDCVELMVFGYSVAIQNHDIAEPVRDFNREFGAYLRKTYGWSMSTGPYAAIARSCSSDPEASWAALWRYLDEFRESL